MHVCYGSEVSYRICLDDLMGCFMPCITWLFCFLWFPPYLASFFASFRSFTDLIACFASTPSLLACFSAFWPLCIFCSSKKNYLQISQCGLKVRSGIVWCIAIFGLKAAFKKAIMHAFKAKIAMHHTISQTHIHTHIHTYTHTYIHTDIHTHMHTYIHTSHIYTHTYIHTYIHTLHT